MYSNLHKKSYIEGAVFLEESQILGSSTHMTPKDLRIKEIWTHGTEVDPFSHIIDGIIEYIIYPPRVWVDAAHIKVGAQDVCFPLGPGNKVCIYSGGQLNRVLSVPKDVKANIVHHRRASYNKAILSQPHVAREGLDM